MVIVLSRRDARASSLDEVVSFMAGVLALLLALTSPLDALGDTYLFSGH
jgi:cytochrome c oxidase assembly factor CtaG